MGVLCDRGTQIISWIRQRGRTHSRQPIMRPPSWGSTPRENPTHRSRAPLPSPPALPRPQGLPPAQPPPASRCGRNGPPSEMFSNVSCSRCEAWCTSAAFSARLHQASAHTALHSVSGGTRGLKRHAGQTKAAGSRRWQREQCPATMRETISARPGTLTCGGQTADSLPRPESAGSRR